MTRTERKADIQERIASLSLERLQVLKDNMLPAKSARVRCERLDREIDQLNWNWTHA